MQNRPRPAHPPTGPLAFPQEVYEDRRGDRFLYLDPQNLIWFQTDQLGKAGLDALACHGTVAAAAPALAAEASTDPERAEALLSDLALRLLDLGFLHPRSYRRTRWGDGLLRFPFVLDLHLADRPELGCPHCAPPGDRRLRTPRPPLDRLLALVDEAADLGFRRLRLRAWECPLHREPAEVARHARERGLLVELGDDGPPRGGEPPATAAGTRQVDPRELRRTQCGAANGVVSVDAAGDLYPCHAMHRPELRGGNIFAQPLRDVLEGSAALCRVKHLTVERLEPCRSCPVRYLCAGGCRMDAYSRHGRLTANHEEMCPVLFRRALDTLWNATCAPDPDLEGTEAWVQGGRGVECSLVALGA